MHGTFKDRIEGIQANGNANGVSLRRAKLEIYFLEKKIFSIYERVENHLNNSARTIYIH